MQKKIVKLNLSGELIVRSGEADGCYDSLSHLLEAVKIPAVILIDGLQPEDDNNLKACFDAICQLRRSNLLYAAPIFLAKSIGHYDAFADGVESTKDAILPRAAEILSKLGGISTETNAGNDDLRLLTFLFCRGEGYSLAPLLLAASPWIYEYPAAVLIGGYAVTVLHRAFPMTSTTDSTSAKTALRSTAEWMASLCAQGFLTSAGLVDRIRICPHCQTGKLNYIDCCPLCSSIDFSKKKMIHCFTCGHVAPEENFRKGMMLICPRCDVTLRHIGSDYDRPVESHVCNSCHERFIEPEVKADCLNCRRKSQAEELDVRQLYNYVITAKGKQAVQLGVIHFEFSLFDSSRNVLPLYFYQVTDWLLQMKKRYRDEEFSLLCIKIMEIGEPDSTAGMSQYKNIMDELATRIRELVRVTDITTSTGTNIFWVLLPRTNQQGGEVLAGRIEKLADMVSLENGARIVVKVKCFSIPAEYADRGPMAQQLLGEFEDNLQGAR